MSVAVGIMPDKNNKDKFDILMNKFTLLEEAFKDERRTRIAHEEEINTLKKITIPNLQKQLEDKESLLKTTFIEKIKMEKIVLEKQKSENTNVNDSIFSKGNDNLQSSKLEHYQNAYKELRKKYNELAEEKMKLDLSYNSKLEIEKEKNNILLKESGNVQNKMQRNLNDLKYLSESNKNLLVEIKSINLILEEVNKHKETMQLELSFYKNELDLTKSNLRDALNRLKKIENDFKAVSKVLVDTQNKLSNMDISSHIFNVIRVGRLYESNTDLVFTKDEKGHLVLIIKYVTTSVKYQILDIKEIKFKDGEENMIYIEFKPEKNLRNENFRTSEGTSIIRIYQEFQKKAIEQSDQKKIDAEQTKKIENIGANLKDILSFP